MKIAVQAICGTGDHLLDLSRELALEANTHQFLFLLPEGTAMPAAGNTTIQHFRPANTLLQRRAWLELRLPPILKKWGAEVLISPAGACSSISRLPQVLGVPDLLFLQPGDSSGLKRNALKLQLSGCVKKAAAVITPSASVQQELLQFFPQAAGKTWSIPPRPSPAFRPLEWQEADSVKDGFADGREYFLFPGGFATENNLMNVLKAFSRFKVWQHSNMKLLVTGNLGDASGMKDKLSRYKFREDVVLAGEIPEEQLARVFASAYAVVYPPLYSGNGKVVAEAMQAGTAVITSASGATSETGGSGVLAVDPGDDAAIAAEMIRLYKDEALRSRLIASAIERAGTLAGQPATKELWERIASIAGK